MIISWLKENLMWVLGIGIPLVITALVWLIKTRLKRRKKAREVIEKNKKLFEVHGKKPSELEPSCLLKGRPYTEYHHLREEDEEIRRRLEAGEDVLILGQPLAGKTRAAYEALKKLPEDRRILIPKLETFGVDFIFPPVKDNAILVLDNLHEFVKEDKKLHNLLDPAMKAGVQILGTCRTGVEYDPALSRLEDPNLESLKGLFKKQDPVKLTVVGEEEAEKIAHLAGKDKLPITFDGTIGSIVMDLDAMKKRFREAGSEEKTILRVLQQLYTGGVYRGAQEFPLEWVKLVTTAQGLPEEEFKWKGWLEGLEKNEFLKWRGDTVKIEEAYMFPSVIEPVGFDSIPEFIAGLIEPLSSVPEAMRKLGGWAYDFGINDPEKKYYMIVAIVAYTDALECISKEEDGEEYAGIQNDLGIALGNLGDIEDKAANCRLAIAAYEEALKVYTPEDFPMDYAMTQNNLGIAYETLGGVEDKAANCRRAITAYEEALKVYTLEDFPMQYAATQNNLAVAYVILGEVEDKAANCRRAIAACKEALKVRTLEDFSRDYAMTQNNLGIAYETLGGVEDKAAYCHRAIAAYEEALKVYTLEDFPMQYAATQNNLAVAYVILGEVEDKASNCRLAIAAYEEVLKVYTLEDLPMQYAKTQNNLGIAYGNLGDVENKADNCRLAVAAFEEALKVRTLDDFPMQYATTQNNLAIAYRNLGDVENKAENCRRAIAACKEALKVHTVESLPINYAQTQWNLANAYSKLAEVENPEENTRLAEECRSKARPILEREGLL